MSISREGGGFRVAHSRHVGLVIHHLLEVTSFGKWRMTFNYVMRCKRETVCHCIAVSETLQSSG